jgi:hypothetical protein
MRAASRLSSIALCAIWLRLVAPVPAGAEVQPGDVITRANADKIHGLVSPGVEWLVRRGMEMTIIPYRKYECPAHIRDATEKYSGQVTINDRGGLEGWVAGIPFPRIDPADPQAGLKLMYNVTHPPTLTDDLGLHLLDAESGTIPADPNAAGFEIERHFVIEWIRFFHYLGRLTNDPKPAFPDNGEGVYRKMAQYPFLEPFDLKGVGLLSFRYLDPEKQDDTWLHLPQMRRVRRLSSAQRSDALFGQDVDLDSYNIYMGHAAWFDWKLLGEKQMLGSFHGVNLPAKLCEGNGGATFCENWEMRPVWIVEGKAKMPGYAYSKRIIYVDQEALQPLYSDLYDPAGELWKVLVHNFRVSTKPNPKADLEYPYELPFIYGFLAADIQLHHLTRVAIPGREFTNEPGWYFNFGDKYGNREEAFTVSAMLAAGR